MTRADCTATFTDSFAESIIDSAPASWLAALLSGAGDV
jgi:hypothetical protein